MSRGLMHYGFRVGKDADGATTRRTPGTLLEAHGGPASEAHSTPGRSAFELARDWTADDAADAVTQRRMSVFFAKLTRGAHQPLVSL